MERLQKYMADCGVASRRKSEELILAGEVTVNGVTVRELGTKIDPQKDVVAYRGKAVKPQKKKIYILLNKPEGYVTTARDQFNRPTVIDLIKKDVKERVVPVGRLDYDTSGIRGKALWRAGQRYDKPFQKRNNHRRKKDTPGKVRAFKGRRTFFLLPHNDT